MGFLNSKISIFRKKHGLTQRALAKELGVSLHSVFRWENCKIEPRSGKLCQMANLFGCDIKDLVESEDNGGESA